MPLAGQLIRASDSRAVDYASQASNVTLSTTAGVYSDIVVGNVFTPVANRRYLCTFYGGDQMLVAGSGFATTDAWRIKFQVSVAGGAYADLVPGNGYLARCYVAASTRYIIAPSISDYLAGSIATLQFKVQAAKSSGAGTVTSTLETGTGAAPFTLLVEDVGEI